MANTVRRRNIRQLRQIPPLLSKGIAYIDEVLTTYDTDLEPETIIQHFQDNTMYTLEDEYAQIFYILLSMRSALEEWTNDFNEMLDIFIAS